MNTRRRLQGVVVSDKMEKTVVVEIKRTYRHPLYQKVVHSVKRLIAHDEMDCRIGDQVQIIETKPISKTKRWAVEKVTTKREEKDIPVEVVDDAVVELEMESEAEQSEEAEG
jgi:small subunit ribosomal protein S17